MSVFVPVPYHLITVALLVLFEIRGHDASSFVGFFFPPQDCFDCLGSFVVLFYYFMKNVMFILIEIALNW